MTFLRRAAVALASAPAAALMFAAPAQAADISNDITVQKGCTASGVQFEVRAEWKYTYLVDGVWKAKIDRLEWSIQGSEDADEATPGVQAQPQGKDAQYDQDADTTDYSLRVYSDNTRIQTLSSESADVYYANDGENGELWFGRNPKNPEIRANADGTIAAGDNSRVTFFVGVADDGQPKCKVSFRVPANLGPRIAE